MIIAESRREEEIFPPAVCSKKNRIDSTSSVDSTAGTDNQTAVRNLELEGVKEIFQDYDLLEGTEAVACVVCGKNYKSKVCVKKHLWEHSVYWDLFDGLKKQQRVLSIQAAIILAIKFNPSLSRLLVTQPSNSHKRKAEKIQEKQTTVAIETTVNNKSQISTHTQDKNMINDYNNNTYNNNMFNFESPVKKTKITDLTTTTSPSLYEEKNSIDFLTNLSVTRTFESLSR